MPYDKYRNWGPDSPLRDIKNQLLLDLQTYAEEVDRLELLDSFEAFVKRQHQNELVEDLAHLIVDKAILPVLTDFLKAQLPLPRPLSRGRMGKAS